MVPEKKACAFCRNLGKASQSVQLCLNRMYGELVLDDEHLGSHAKDDKLKVLSTRRQKKKDQYLNFKYEDAKNSKTSIYC